MKLVTFNIRYDCGQDGINNFCFRKSLIQETIAREAPDILCFQEVLPHIARWLREVLADYYVVGCPREEGLLGEQVCIAYRPDRYNLMKMDTYWLSETPFVPGSRYPEQSICPRTCTELTLQELSSGQVFRLVNTHLDHEGSGARIRGAEQILKKLDTEPFFPGVPAILTGDLNAEPDSPEIGLLCANMRNLTAGIGATFHDFGRCAPVQIDYIFARGGIQCGRVEKWTDCRGGVYLSDHYPICAELSFSSSAALR